MAEWLARWILAAVTMSCITSDGMPAARVSARRRPHPHMERRYLIVPGIGSSRIYILDTKPNPKQPKIVKVIEPEEFIKKTGYTAPHTFHCGPDASTGAHWDRRAETARVAYS